MAAGFPPGTVAAARQPSTTGERFLRRDYGHGWFTCPDAAKSAGSARQRREPRRRAGRIRGATARVPRGTAAAAAAGIPGGARYRGAREGPDARAEALVER